VVGWTFAWRCHYSYGTVTYTCLRPTFQVVPCNAFLSVAAFAYRPLPLRCITVATRARLTPFEHTRRALPRRMRRAAYVGRCLCRIAGCLLPVATLRAPRPSSHTPCWILRTLPRSAVTLGQTFTTVVPGFRTRFPVTWDVGFRLSGFLPAAAGLPHTWTPVHHAPGACRRLPAERGRTRCTYTCTNPLDVALRWFHLYHGGCYTTHRPYRHRRCYRLLRAPLPAVLAFTRCPDVYPTAGFALRVRSRFIALLRWWFTGPSPTATRTAVRPGYWITLCRFVATCGCL